MRRLILLIHLLVSPAFANVITDPPLPLSHCYHWVQSRFLDVKFDHAAKNDGELFFSETAKINGAVAGPGLYCAKSPSQSADYGDRLIRIDFVEDVVVLDDSTGKKYCGPRGDALPEAECQTKDWDVRFYQRRPEWYVIRNAAVIAKWSVASAELVSDLQAEAKSAPSFAYKAPTVIAAIKGDVSVKGEIVYFNGKARTAAVDLLVKDPARVQTLPPTTVLAMVLAARSGQLDAGRIKEIRDLSIQRVLNGRESRWPWLQSLIKRDSTLRSDFVKVIEGQFQQKGTPFANLEVMLGLADVGVEELSNETIRQLVDLAMENPNAVNWSDLSLTAGSPLAAVLEPRIVDWVMRGNPRERLAEILPLYRFSMDQMKDVVSKDKIRRAVEAAFPAAKDSTVTLVAGSSAFGLGSDAASMVALCRAQIMLNDLYDKDLSFRLGGERTLTLGRIARGAEQKTVCEKFENLTAQYLALKGKGAEPIYIVVGNINGSLIQFAVDGPESLAAATVEYVQKNPRTTYGSSMTLSLLGGSSTSSNASGAWTGSDLPDAVVAVGQVLGIRTPAQAAQVERVQKSSAEYKILIYFYGERGLLGNASFAVDILETFERECSAASRVIDLRTVRIASAFVNDRSLPSGSVRGSTAEGLCKSLSEMAGDRIPNFETKAKIEKVRSYKSIYQVKAPELGTLVIGANTIDDVQAHCGSEMKTVKFKPFESLILRQEGVSQGDRVDAEKGPWKTKEAVCAAVVKELRSSLPTAAQVRIESRKAKFRIEAQFGYQTHTFVVDNKKELAAQCAQLVRNEEVGSIVWNGDVYGSISRERGSWTKAADMCAVFVKKIELKK